MLGILLFVSIVSDCLGFIMHIIGKVAMPIILNIYTILEFFLLSYIYYLFGKDKKLVITISILFTLFFIVDSLFVESIYKFQSGPLFVEGIILLTYAISYYAKTLKVTPPIDPFCFYPFWINSGVFYYFSFNLFLFAISNYVFTNMPSDISKSVWGFHNFNNIMKNLLFAIGIYVARNGLIKQKYH